MGREAADRLFAIYLLLTAPALLFPGRPAGWIAILLLHLVTAAMLLRLRPFRPLFDQLGKRWPRVAGVIGDWYLLALIPLLYTELATLNLAVWQGHYFDSLIIGWEQAIFNSQPSRALALRFNDLALSEFLHASYLSYYFIIYLPPAILYLRGRREQQRAAVFTVMLSFFAHYLFFVYFPVQGPRYLFEPPGGEAANGIIYGLTHKLLEAGSSQGAAFPSSHVGVSAAQSLVTLRFLPKLGVLSLFMTIALALGAVYGGFHYATDALAGFALGIACVLAAPALRKRLSAAQ